MPIEVVKDDMRPGFVIGSGHTEYRGDSSRPRVVFTSFWRDTEWVTISGEANSFVSREAAEMYLSAHRPIIETIPAP